MKLLLVEDEPAIAEPLCLLLRGESWQVFRSETVFGALSLLEQQAFDAAVIDLGLPDGDGLTVCRAARRAGDAAIVVLTARADEASAVISLDAGADDYIIKPFRARELISRLRDSYDYILIDCPPIEIVADTQIIEKAADRTIFVVRADLLERSMLPVLENIYREKRFKNMALILNGTNSRNLRYGYGSRHGYHYGYGYYAYGSSKQAKN